MMIPTKMLKTKNPIIPIPIQKQSMLIQCQSNSKNWYLVIKTHRLT